MPNVTLSGALPPEPCDGLSPFAAYFLDPETRTHMRIGLVLVSASKVVEKLDKPETYPVLQFRHIELATDDADVKELSDILGRLFGGRTGVMALPFDVGDEAQGTAAADASAD